MGGTQWIPSYADQIVQNGTQLIMGDLLLKAVHTPGHTPEHVIWVVYDKTRSSGPLVYLYRGLPFCGKCRTHRFTK